MVEAVTRGGAPPRDPWRAFVAAAVLAAAGRACVAAARDGYAAGGLIGLAARCASRDFLLALGPCLGVALAAWLTSRAWRRTWLRLAAAAGVAAAAWAYASGRFPALPVHPAGFAGARAPAVHAIAGAAALLAAVAVAAGPGIPRRGWNAALAGAALLVAAAASAWLGGVSSSGGGERAGERPNVILISLDTTRADRLGCYGHPLPTTPEIDLFFARDSVRFESAFAPQPWTLTSHLTLLTSLHPIVHGATAERGLPPGVATLAQLLADQGWLAIGLVHDLPWMEERYGFDRGFHAYRRMGGSASARQGRIAALLDDLAGERFFLFLHYYDAHSDRGELPYESALEDAPPFTSWYRGDFPESDGRGLDGTDLHWTLNREGASLSEDDRRWLGSLYDAGLRTLDRALGGLFRALAQRGLLDRTIVVLTADHGEEFQEHGKLLHTQAYEECLRVPLLFRVPGAGAARASDALVSLADVAPTLLDLCGVEAPPAMEGRSLRACLAGADDPFDRSRLLLMDESGRLAIRTGEWKLVTTEEGSELYDLSSDPAEKLDLMKGGAAPEAAAGLLRLLEDESRRAFARRAESGIADAHGVTLSPEELEQLRALGYAVDGS